MMHSYHAGLRPPQTRNLAASGTTPSFKAIKIASLPVTARIPRRKSAACPSAKVMDKVEVETTSEPHSVRDGSNGAAAAQQYSKPRSRGVGGHSNTQSDKEAPAATTGERKTTR